MSPATMALPPPTPPPPQTQSEEGSETPKKRAISEDPPSSASAPKKKTKMTEEERRAKEEEKRKEKEVREKEREVKKAEREEKKRVKDEEKRVKDEEKRKREEEKARKERAQPRLDYFFKVPNTPKKEPPNDRSSISPAPLKANVVVVPQTDYQKYLFPFFVKKNMVVAPPHSFERDEEGRLAICRALDEALSLPNGPPEDAMDTDDGEVPAASGITREEIIELLHIPPHKARSRRGNIPAYSTKDILARIENPVDPGLPPLVTGGVKQAVYNSAYYLSLLNKLPHKFLKFAEDVRPPYNGTYTRKPDSSGLRTGRKPFDRTLPGVNYDYDSEAEWVADEEGEELLSEDEEDKESEAGDSLDGFLDDEEDVGLKRGGPAVLIPTNSGMCWEDASGKTVRPGLEEMRLTVLVDGLSAPIDPFSAKYWEPRTATENKPRPTTILTAMDPPRKPLVSTNRTLPSTTAVSSVATAKKDAQKKLVPPEYMEDFKRAIDGSDMTKTGLIEQLKKAFPKVGKDNIKNTLELVAERVGEKRDDKRWVLK